MKHFGYKSSANSASSSQAPSPVSTAGLHFEDEAERVINFCKDDISALWNDKVVRSLLHERNVRLELEGGFFLDDVDRVCALDFEPNDCECSAPLYGPILSHRRTFSFCKRTPRSSFAPGVVDVCKARLKTMGVTETNFCVKQGLTATGDWRVYDVGGSRTVRSAWAPFFDDGAPARFIYLFQSIRV
jgi:guanine nucleotide-binding protein subunit alpha